MDYDADRTRGSDQQGQPAPGSNQWGGTDDAQPTAARPAQPTQAGAAGQASSTAWYDAQRARQEVGQAQQGGWQQTYAQQQAGGQQGSYQQPGQTWQQTYAQQTAPTPPAPPAPPEHGGKHGERVHGHGFGPGKGVLFGILGGIIGTAILTGCLYAAGIIGPSKTTSTSSSGSSGSAITITTSDEDTSTATAVAAKATASVVSVYCTYSNGSGIGSGVILDTDGDIITNYHVIDGATAISVTIDGNSYEATVVGSDSSSDLAVIKAELNGDSVTPIEVGDSSDLSVGDWVMTIGSPFGLEQSVSQGIVSALYRNELMESTSGNTIYCNLIQVDAAINPGNSGGALVNSEGKLVGICTLYSSSTESFAGIGFAIPGNYAVEIANKIISGETVTHAYIGLSMQTVNAQNASSNLLSVNQGAYVAEVLSGSPAESAGIEAGDIIIAIDGEEITSADGMILAVRSHETGDTVTVTVMRGDEKKDFTVTLGSDEALQTTSADTNTENTDSGTDSGTNSDVEQELEQWYEKMQEQQNSTNGGTSTSNPFGGQGSSGTTTTNSGTTNSTNGYSVTSSSAGWKA